MITLATIRASRWCITSAATKERRRSAHERPDRPLPLRAEVLLAVRRRHEPPEVDFIPNNLGLARDGSLARAVELREESALARHAGHGVSVVQRLDVLDRLLIVRANLLWEQTLNLQPFLVEG